VKRDPSSPPNAVKNWAIPVADAGAGEEGTGVVRMWHANSSDDASFCSVGSADVAFHLGFRHCG
jgi:hypothetical protein